MLSSSGMTFHINLLFVTHLFVFLLCFGPTLLCKVTPNMWLYKPLSNIVHLSVCCFCFVFLNVPSLYWCELQCQCSQLETWPASGQFPQTLDETQDVCMCLMFWAFQHSMTAICWSFKLYIHHTLVTFLFLFFFGLYHSSTVFTKNSLTNRSVMHLLLTSNKMWNTSLWSVCTLT